MKKKRLLLLIILSSALIAKSQNLVPNPSFEKIKQPLKTFMENNEFHKYIIAWSNPNTGSPDIITPAFKSKIVKMPTAHSGLAAAGIHGRATYCEYIGVALTEALIPNRTYLVEYYMRKAVWDYDTPGINKDLKLNEDFGILFTIDSIQANDNKIIKASPQIKADSQLIVTTKSWLKVSAYFTPKKKYSKLYLGQFKHALGPDKISDGYYLIDDVSIQELTNIVSFNKSAKLSVGNVIPLKDLNFASGSTKLNKAKSYNILKDLVEYLTLNPTVRVRINGHTDTQGKPTANFILSQQRAQVIAQLITDYGVSNDRIEWKGFGATVPIATNLTKQGRLKNRRVEFEIIK